MLTEPERIRVVVADDHELVLQGLKSVLETVPEWHVCGTAQDGRKAVELAPQDKQAWSNLALAYDRLGRPDDAARARRSADDLARAPVSPSE